MATRTNGPGDTELRERLKALADGLIRATPARRRELAAEFRRDAHPAALRALAGALVARVGYKSAQVHTGAADALVALGPVALPALELRLLRRPREALLL